MPDYIQFHLFITFLSIVYCTYRAQQQEQKEMQLRLQQEYDPGNPDWQFIQMIR